jgi:hypothetical protein
MPCQRSILPIDPDDVDTKFWQMYADGFSGLVTGETAKLEAALSSAELQQSVTGSIAAASFLATVAAWTGRLDLAETALATTALRLRDLGQPMTCDTSFSGHAAAIWVATTRGRFEEAKLYVQPQLPTNAFMLLISGAHLAWLGFVTGDQRIHEIARGWVDRRCHTSRAGWSPTSPC